jgi:predicted amidophosphoribosyltransferase
MPTVEELVLQYGLAESVVTVPPVASGVCSVCHGCPGVMSDGTPWATCWSCTRVMEQLTHPCNRVVPVSLCRKAPVDPKAVSTGSQLYDWLVRYKSDWSSEATRARFSTWLLAILSHFLERHWGCLTLGGLKGIDVMTVVPSTKPDRAGDRHPLHRAMSTVTGLPAPLEVLLQRGPGILDRLQPSDDGFVPVDPAKVTGRRALILDDTFTSATKSQSAASALRRAGADVVGIVPIGRLIDPTYVPAGQEVEPGQGEHQKWWDRQLAQPFSFATCCIH